MEAVSVDAVISTGAVVVCSSVSDRPGTVPARVLLAALIAMPLMVACGVLPILDASSAAMPEPAAGSSKASADSPGPPVWVPSSLACTRKPAASPVALERSMSRSPDRSFSTVAVTPAPAALILTAMAGQAVAGRHAHRDRRAVLLAAKAGLGPRRPIGRAEIDSVPLPMPEPLATAAEADRLRARQLRHLDAE